MPATSLDAHSFEQLLTELCQQLTAECERGAKFAKSIAFETRAREILKELVAQYGMAVDFDPHPYVFPDIVLGEYGIEVKFTTNDTWRSVANSVFESTRSPQVRHIYILFGKMGVSYQEFSRLPLEQRMQYIRKYARGRLKAGERLWWLGDQPEPEHSLPLQARLYMSLPQEEKRKLRAEAALLCPQVVKPSRSKGKYDDAALYLLTYHGVLCSQARDLFSAGSVALRSDAKRGGRYIERALKDIEEEIRAAARRLEDALFVEYWGASVPPEKRIHEWLTRADKLARTWKPSQALFLSARKSR